MKIRHYSFSKTGGAGNIANRLVEYQKALGFDSQIISTIEKTIRDELLRNKRVTLQATIDKYLVTKSKNPSMYSNFRSHRSSEITLEQKQVSHLHWIPGVIDIDDLPFVTEVSSKVVWTLHDMWAFTGGCHYSLNCEKFKLSCSRCPQVRNIFSKIPRAQLSDKKKVFEKVLSKIVFVTPSHWLKQQAAASRTLMNADIRVVKNPIDLPRFLAVSNVAEVRAKLLIKSTDFVVGCAAMNLSDPLKNIEFIAQVVAKFADSQTLSPRRVVLLCIGSGSIQGVYSSENLRIIGTGQVSQDELVRIYSAMDVFVSAAKAENFPNTLIEALACGVPLICSNVGGMPEIVIESKSGYLFDQENENELFQALLALFNQKELKRAFSVAATEYIRKEFLNSRTQEKYLSIYQE